MERSSMFDPLTLAVDGEDANGKSPSSPDWVPSKSDIPAPPWGSTFRKILAGDCQSNWGHRPDRR